MSQLEQRVRTFLGRRPEIEKCYREGLLNRRALARHLVAQGVGTRDQFDAVVATLRRLELAPAPDRKVRDLFPEVRLALKDRILILDFEKEKALLERLEGLIDRINYDRGDTLKIVLGTSSLKLIVDQRLEETVRKLFDRFKVRHRSAGISEISLTFPEEAIETRGILSVIAREFALNDLTIAELLTASPELLIYLKEEFVPKAYGLLRQLQQSS